MTKKKQWNPQQFDKNDIFEPKYLLTTNKSINSVYAVIIQNFCWSLRHYTSMYNWYEIIWFEIVQIGSLKT